MSVFVDMENSLFIKRCSQFNWQSFCLFKYHICMQDWNETQADLSLRWTHMPFRWFCHEATHIKRHHSFRVIINDSSKPEHDKTYRMTCAPSQDLDQLGHPLSLMRVFTAHMKNPCPWLWSECQSEDIDQIAEMRRLIWVLAVHTCHLYVLSFDQDQDSLLVKRRNDNHSPENLRDCQVLSSVVRKSSARINQISDNLWSN